MSLSEQLENIRESLKKGRYYNNEAAISQGVILPILHELGWPVFNTQVVIPEYQVEGRRVDFALCYPTERPVIFIEVKKMGGADGADRQLFEYAFHQGIPFTLLTDGQEWNFYLPGEVGQYQERRVYKLDILQREIDDILYHLDRYLKYDQVCSGAALKSARNDYQDISRKREMERTFPQAWQRLIQEKDDILLELLASKVTDLCGFEPDLDMCANFLDGVKVDTSVTIPMIIAKEKKSKSLEKEIVAKEKSLNSKIRKSSFIFRGKLQHFALE